MEVFWQIVLYDSEGAQITAADGWQQGPQTLLIAQQAPAELLLCVSYSLGNRMCKHMHLRFRSLTHLFTHSLTHPPTHSLISNVQCIRRDAHMSTYGTHKISIRKKRRRLLGLEVETDDIQDSEKSSGKR